MISGRRDVRAKSEDVFSFASLRNTLLVDGEAGLRGRRRQDYLEIFENNAHIVQRVRKKEYDYMAADLTAYFDRPPNPFQELIRHTLFVRPDYAVTVDRLVAFKPHAFDWVCHFTGALRLEGDWVKGGGEEDDLLGVRILRPSFFVASTGRRRVKRALNWVRIRPTRSPVRMRFAMLLYPTTEAAWDRKPAITVHREDERGLEMTVAMPDGRRDGVEMVYGAEGYGRVVR